MDNASLYPQAVRSREGSEVMFATVDARAAAAMVDDAWRRWRLSKRPGRVNRELASRPPTFTLWTLHPPVTERHVEAELSIVSEA